MGKMITNSKLFLKRNSSTILTYAGVAGVITTTAMAINATPKAMQILEEAKEEKGEDLTKFEVATLAVPTYIPTIAVGMSSIACILGANVLNKRSQASLMSAYALVNKSYKEYRDKIVDLYGDTVEERVIEEIAKDNYEEEDVPEDDGKELFYDELSKRYFRSTVEDVQRAEYRINRTLIMEDYATVNDFYDLLGIPHIEGGDRLGWAPNVNYDCYWQMWIDFTHQQIVMDDGTECRIVRILTDPIMDFETFYD